MWYEVRIIERHSLTYLVTADSPTDAERIARNAYTAGDDGESTGSEWSSIESITVQEVPRSKPDAALQAPDCTGDV